MSRLRLGLGALAIALALVLGICRSGSREPVAPVAPVAKGDPAPPGEPEPPPPIPPDPELPPAVQQYLATTRYPPSSGRLSADQLDLLEPNRRHERPRPIRETLGGDPDEAVYAEFSAERFDLTSAEATAVWLEARRGGAPHRLAKVRGALWLEGRAGREGDPVPLRFSWRNERHEAELERDAIADHHGFVVAEVQFESPPGTKQLQTLRFSHTPESLVPARFTGQFADYVRDGALRVEVGLEVEQPGFYRLDANFYDRHGEPAAFASFKGNLDAGRQVVPIEVFGKVLRDTGAVGPYTLGELRGYRFVDGGFPDRESIPGPGPVWQTGSYALEEFSGTEWDSDHKRRMVELMLQDEAAGISLDLPPAADAAPPPPGVP